MGLGKVLDGAVDLTKSWGKTLSANKTVDRRIARDILQNEKASKILRGAAKESGGTTAAASEAIAKRMDDVATAGRSTRKDVKGMDSTRDKVKAYRDMNRSTAVNGSLPPTKMQTLGADIKTATGLTSEYFTGGSVGQNLTRMGTVGGAYMGANMIGRSVTGGTLTKNNKGERDIAGIPFL